MACYFCVIGLIFNAVQPVDLTVLFFETNAGFGRPKDIFLKIQCFFEMTLNTVEPDLN